MNQSLSLILLLSIGFLDPTGQPKPKTSKARVIDPRVSQILTRAIEAHGGKEILSRLRADRVQTRGVLHQNGMQIPFTAETAVELPNRFKNVMELQVQDKKRTITQVVNDSAIWEATDGKPLQLPPQAAADLREILYRTQVLRLLPLLQDPSFQLTFRGEGQVHGRPAPAILVSSPGHKPIHLYFDKESALLVMTEHSMVDRQTKQEVTQVVLYSDFRVLSGYKRAIKVAAFRGGQKVMEGELIKVEYLDKLNDREFTKP